MPEGVGPLLWRGARRLPRRCDAGARRGIREGGGVHLPADTTVRKRSGCMVGVDTRSGAARPSDERGQAPRPRSGRQPRPRASAAAWKCWGRCAAHAQKRSTLGRGRSAANGRGRSGAGASALWQSTRGHRRRARLFRARSAPGPSRPCEHNTWPSYTAESRGGIRDGGTSAAVTGRGVKHRGAERSSAGSASMAEQVSGRISLGGSGGIARLQKRGAGVSL